ncbi:GNAT family N-acetyltransferase [Nocardioides sp. MAHUQ-72]|uniref:GNAT family N-acetyltransferase n=1 Tax=unclassified Nocardioides TaxID=2615069 RepID=UPI003609ABAE
MRDETHDDRLEVVITEDPAEFLALAEQHLALDPVVTTVVSTVTHRALDQVRRGVPVPDHPRWWAVVRDAAGTVVGTAMRTAPFAPYPLFVLDMADEAAVALARAVHARGEEVGGANGVLPATRVVAEEVARLQGHGTSVWEHTRLFELGDLVEPAPVPGAVRAATDADIDLCLQWFQAFAADAAEQAGREHEEGAGEYFTREDMVERVVRGRVWLWEVEGEPVHLTGFNPPSFGVARVGPVYTPREHRGRGYASAAVAAVSRRLLDEGARVCLFTDQANPTSNRIYQALGYRPVVDMANLRVG